MAGENDFDDYLSSVADLPKDSTSSDTQTDTQVQEQKPAAGDVVELGTPEQKTGQQDATQQQQAKPPKVDDKDQQQADKDQKPDAQQQQKLKKGIRKSDDGNLIDTRGNIVDENGTILAPVGKTRRIYERNQRLERQVENLTRERDTLHAQSRETQLLNGIANGRGLTNDDLAVAIDIAAKMKRGDALGAAKDVIAILAAQGHNVSDLLGNNVGDAVEMRAIKQMIQEATAPLRQQQQNQQVDAEARQRGEAAYNQFVADNEYADVHANEIARLAEKDGISPQQAYNRLSRFAIANDLDFSLPLRDQILERATALQANNGQQAQQQQRQAKPMPNGGSATRPVNGVQPKEPIQADPDEDWGSIIARAQASDRATQH